MYGCRATLILCLSGVSTVAATEISQTEYLQRYVIYYVYVHVPLYCLYNNIIYYKPTPLFAQ